MPNKALRFIVIVFLVLIYLTSCKDKHEWTNPLDYNGDLTPDQWAPANLTVSQQSVKKVQLTWEQSEEQIEGFKIDRKVGANEWQEAFTTIDKTNRIWIDSNAVALSQNYYRLYAYAGKSTSAVREANINPAFPAPSDLTIEQLSVTNLKLNWQDNSIDEDGFVIERHTGDGTTFTNYKTLAANTTTWTDSNAVPTDVNYYRVYAFVNQVSSEAIEFSLNPSFPSPSNLNVNQISDVEIELSWIDNSDGEEGYKIDRKVGDGNWQDGYAVTEPNATSWSDIEPVYGEVNYYRVYGFNGEKHSAAVEGSVYNIIQAPSEVNFLQTNDHSIAISWKDNCNFETGYVIEKSINDDPFLEIERLPVNATSWSDTSLLWINNYAYRLSAFTQQNYSEYAELNNINVEFPAPTNLKLTLVSETDIQLDWEDNCDFESGFRIEKDIGSGFSLIAEVDANTTNYIDNSALWDQEQSFRVSGFTSLINSDYTNLALIHPAIQTAPTDLQIKQDAEYLKLSWKDNCIFEDGFRIERSDDGGAWQQVADISADSTEYIDLGSKLGILYTYRVYTYIEDKQSTYSNEVDGQLHATVTDIDGNVYKTIEIDKQVWMAENLKVTHYRNGEEIPYAVASNPINSHSLNFDGISDNVNITYSALTPGNLCTGSFSLEAWIKLNVITGNQTIIAFGHNSVDPMLFEVSDGRPRVHTEVGGGEAYFTADTILQIDTWYHVAWVGEYGVGGTFYLNGIDVGSSPSWTAMQGTVCAIGMGYTGRFFSGYIDEVRVWKRVISDTEIRENLYSKLDPSQESDLLGYWQFNEGSGTTAYDLSGNDYHGTINDATWSDDLPFTDGVYFIYDNDINNNTIYGSLYNWYAVNDLRGLAPDGWHVPTDDEWKELELFLGMSQNDVNATSWRGTDEGGILKEIGTEHWQSPNTAATDEFGFTALPGGWRNPPPFGSGNYENLQIEGYFWTSTGNSSDGGWSRKFGYYDAGIYRSYDDKQVGYSVRCIKD